MAKHFQMQSVLAKAPSCFQ